MPNFSHLFREYAHLTPQQNVMTTNVHDDVYLQELASAVGSLTIYHCDYTIQEELKIDFTDDDTVHIPGTVFPSPHSETSQGYDLAIVQIPVSPSFAIGIMTSALMALAPDGYLIAAGNKILGGRTTIRKIQSLMDVTILDESGDDIIFCVNANVVPTMPEEWHQAYKPQQKRYTVNNKEYTIHTQPGIFSWQRIDPGPAYFLKHIQEVDIKPGGCIMDAGCGYGLLGLAMQDYCQPRKTVWVDKNILAAQCTQLSAPDGVVLAADLLHSDFGAHEPFDVIFCVPPFYDAYTEGTGFMEAFAPRAGQMLGPDGILIIVANRVLKFGKFLKQAYAHVNIIDDGGDFQMMIASL